MIKFLPVLAFILSSYTLAAQKINGQWRGYFNSNGDIVLTGGDNTEYVLEIEINGSEVSGFSYSYFQNRRFYVICSLSGTYYKSTKSMKVTETARIKGFTPPDWSDCLQTHILSYEMDGNTEELKGRWVTAPGQTGNCGTGLTTLTRRTVSKNLSSFNKSSTTNNTPFSPKKPAAKSPSLVNKNRKPANPPVAKVEPGETKALEGPVVKANPVEKDIPEMIAPEKSKQVPEIVESNRYFDKRSSEIIKTINIENTSFKVDLYDNGDIDGDSVSLFYNGKLLLSHKRLTDKPISFTLDVKSGDKMNELTMYAENLGSIPPNTALMIITDGDKRYEVRITSDLKKSGTIRFLHRSGAQSAQAD